MKYVAISAFVALVGAAACNNSGKPAAGVAPGADQQAPRAQPAGNESAAASQPVSLTGCLQQGDGRADYILTQSAEPSAEGAPVPTKGDGSTVEKEQLHAAQHAYRLSPAKDVADDGWPKLVGTKVHVDGTLTKRSEVGTGGTTDDRASIHERDLARVDVTALRQVAKGCGGTSRPRKARAR